MTTHLEKFIQSEILEWLHTQGYMAWRNSNVPTKGRRNITVRGMPDIFMVRRGMLYGIEVKTNEKGARMSPEQIAWGDNLIMHGGHYCVAHSLKEVIDFIASVPICIDDVIEGV